MKNKESVASTTDHTSSLHRLNRIKGQIDGISNMILEKRYCIDILNQIKSVQAALRSVEFEIFERHLNGCVTDAFKANTRSGASRKMKEIMNLFKSSGGRGT